MEKNESLKNLLEVVKYLRGLGWKISKTAIYRHRDQGKIGPQADGSFLIKDVMKYAGTYLQLQDGTGKRVKVQSMELREKQAAEIRKTIADAILRETKLKILLGEYAPRASHERKMAMRAARLKSDGENYFRNNASEAIRIADGNMTKLPDMIDWLLQLWENLLHRYSEDVEFDLPPAVDMNKLETIEN